MLTRSSSPTISDRPGPTPGRRRGADPRPGRRTVALARALSFTDGVRISVRAVALAGLCAIATESARTPGVCPVGAIGANRCHMQAGTYRRVGANGAPGRDPFRGLPGTLAPSGVTGAVAPSYGGFVCVDGAKRGTYPSALSLGTDRPVGANDPASTGFVAHWTVGAAGAS